jgi:CDP-2,3-bis-(O-geranylgeranyl)-sn-glycerol synthase
MPFDELITALLLLLAANSGPVLAERLLGQQLDWPIDAGRTFLDGQRLFGRSKTWRGLLASLLAASAVAAALGHSVSLGIEFAILAMVGDLMSSFIKRRIRLESSHNAPVLDQLFESLLPLYVMRESLRLSSQNIVGLMLGFTLFELLLEKLKMR